MAQHVNHLHYREKKLDKSYGITELIESDTGLS